MKNKNKKNYVEKIVEYRKNGDKKLKDEVIIDHIDLVKNIVRTFKKSSNLSNEELESYGYEGLLLAFSKFNPEFSLNFENYAYIYISDFIKSGILDVKGCNRSFYVDYQEVRRYVEDVYGVSVLEEPKLVDTILDILLKFNYINNRKESIELARRRIVNDIFGNKSLDDEEVVEELLEDGTLVDPLDYSDIVHNKYLINDIEELLSHLTEEEKFIIKERFGLIDGESKTLVQMRDIINMNISTIYKKEIKALHKLRKEKNNVKVKSYYYNMDAHKYGKQR